MAETIDTRRNATDSYDLQGLIPLRTDRIGNGQINLVDLAHAKWAMQEAAAYAENIVDLREYYDGSQINMLTDRQRAYLEINTDIPFRLNAMKIPVDIMAERMKVVGFDVVDDNEANPQSGETGFLWQVWEANRMDARQIVLQKSSGKDGDAFALVDWDNEKKIPTIHHELAWDGSSGVIVRYRPDNRNKIWYAVKRWSVENGRDAGKVAYMTVYTDSTIENYIGVTGGQDWDRLPDADGNWPIPWVRKDGSPMGCPMFHNANMADGTSYGKSEIQDLMGPQNALDKSVLGELGVADTTGFPIRWATGTDMGSSPVVSPGSIMSSESADVKYGQLAAADLKQLSDIVEKWVVRIAQVSRTPLTFFQTTGQVAAANTQKAGDSPLVSKVTAQAVSTGNFWEDVIGMCRKLHNEFSGGITYDENTISTVWDSFESIDAQEDERKAAETNEIKARTFDILVMNNVDRLTAAKMAGYSDEEAEEMATVSRSNLNGAITQSGASGIAEAAITDNLETDKGLNGAQINAALDVLSGVVTGTTTAAVAIELLVSVGISRERAERMVNDTEANANPPDDLTGITQ